MPQSTTDRAAYMREWRARQRALGVTNARTCDVEDCGQPHIARGLCRKHYRSLVNPDKPRDRRSEIQCSDCGSITHKQIDNRSDQNRCRDCAWRYADAAKRTNWPSRPIHTAACAHCGEPFASRYRRAQCSEECDRLAHAAKYAKTGTCPDCGQSTSKGKRRCASCNLARKADTRRAHKAKRRAWKRSAEAETVSPIAVFVRDAWVCGICGDPVKEDLKYPEAGSASLDHVIPLAKGGTHTYDNCQCSHLSCNLRKGDSLTGGGA